jgi:hypothetical protein
MSLCDVLTGFALCGYVAVTVKPATLWNAHVWWQSIIVWFAAAIIAHDLVLFPVYALLDRMLPRCVPHASAPGPRCRRSTTSGCPRWARA